MKECMKRMNEIVFWNLSLSYYKCNASSYTWWKFYKYCCLAQWFVIIGGGTSVCHHFISDTRFYLSISQVCRHHVELNITRSILVISIEYSSDDSRWLTWMRCDQRQGGQMSVCINEKGLKDSVVGERDGDQSCIFRHFMSSILLYRNELLSMTWFAFFNRPAVPKVFISLREWGSIVFGHVATTYSEGFGHLVKLVHNRNAVRDNSAAPSLRPFKRQNVHWIVAKSVPNRSHRNMYSGVWKEHRLGSTATCHIRLAVTKLLQMSALHLYKLVEPHAIQPIVMIAIRFGNLLYPSRRSIYIEDACGVYRNGSVVREWAAKNAWRDMIWKGQSKHKPTPARCRYDCSTAAPRRQLVEVDRDVCERRKTRTWNAQHCIVFPFVLSHHTRSYVTNSIIGKLGDWCVEPNWCRGQRVRLSRDSINCSSQFESRRFSPSTANQRHALLDKYIALVMTNYRWFVHTLWDTEPISIVVQGSMSIGQKSNASCHEVWTLLSVLKCSMKSEQASVDR